jgi:HlyD family secretion protein
MKNSYTKISTYAAAHKIMSVVIVLILVGGAYYSYKDAKASDVGTSYVLGTVEQGTLTTSITGSGQVSAVNDVSVTPLASGQITSVDVKEGDTVTAGETIGTIDQRSASVALTQAKSSLTSAQASYDKTVNGDNTSQSLAVSQLSITNAQTDEANATTNLQLKIQSDYTATDNLIKSDIDPLYQNPDSFSPVFGIVNYSSGNNSTPITFNIPDNSDKIELGSDRAEITQILNTWQTEVNASSSANIESQVTDAENYIKQIQPLVEDIYSAVNTIYTSNINYQSSISPYKSEVQSARSGLTSTLSDLDSGYQSYQSAEEGVTSAQDQYNVTTAAPLPEDISTAEAQLASAKASYQQAVDNYDNTIITAPIAGIIGDLDLTVGNQAGSASVATIVSPQQLADITLNEVDVAKVQVGQKAMLTFDAIDGLTISGEVAEVSSIGTVTSGVVDYDVKISMDTSDSRIRPGMTVDAAIITNTAPNALYIPSAAIKTSGSGSYVQTLNPLPSGASASSSSPISTKETPQSIQVQTGISNDTDTQITSGLTAGEAIIVRTVQTTTATTATTGSTKSLLSGVTGGGSTRSYGGGGGYGGGTTRTGGTAAAGAR